MDGDQDIVLEGSLNGPARVGAELRSVRERLGWGMGDIAVRLKIRLEFLEAIEDGDLAALPAPTYAAGFIRSYAEALSLDPDEILRRFRAEGMSRTSSPMLVFPETVPDRGVPPGAVALLVAVIAIGGYVIWYGRSEHQMRAANSVPPVPAKLAPMALPKPPIPAPPPALPKLSATKNTDNNIAAAPLGARPASGKKSVIRVTNLAPLFVPPKVAPSTPVFSTSAPLSIAKPSKTAQTPLAPPHSTSIHVVPPKISPPQASPPQIPTSRAETAAAIGGAKAPADASAPRSTNIVIVAALRSWVEVRNLEGKILFSRVMEPGESWPLPDQPGLTITTGNAGGVELIRNGVPGPPLGPSGSVVHSALITPSGTIVPPAQPFRVRHFAKRLPPQQHWANPFAVPITGDQ